MSMDMPPAAMAQDNVSALFLGFLMGAILFGAALLQTYQYFMTYTRDSKRRKFMIAAVLILDTLHLVFSGIMMYLTISRPLRFTDDSLLWALKGFATIKALLIVLVQSYYLSIIWQFASSLTLNIVVSKVIRVNHFGSFAPFDLLNSSLYVTQSICVMLFIYAIGMAIVFLTYLEQDSRFFNFSPSFQTIVYVAFSSTAVIDSTIAGVLSYLLVKASPGGRARTRNVITFLVLFFVGTGLLTAIMAITTIAVYATRPSTVLYLAIEFAVPRLYANSILAMFNSKARLRKRMEVTTELKLSSMLLFDDLPSGSDSDSPPSPEPPEAEKP